MTLTCQKVAARKALSSKLYHPAVLGYSYTTEAATQEIHGPQPSPPLKPSLHQGLLDLHGALRRQTERSMTHMQSELSRALPSDKESSIQVQSS